MTDEQQLRTLLIAATELPDEMPPPVQRLVRLGRRRRTLRTRTRLAAIATVAAAAVASPSVIRTFGPAGPGPVVNHGESGPSPAQLATFHWARLAPSPLRPSSTAVVVVAGRELIELGGIRRGATRAGAAFDLATRRWHEIAPVPGNVAIDFASAVWTGHQLFLIGETPSCRPTCLRDAALYDPAANRWTTTRLPAAMDGLFRLAAVWTGRDVVLAASDSDHGRVGVASFDPATGRWRLITPSVSASHPPRFVAMVATPDRVILWSLWGRFGKSGSVYTEVFGVDVFSRGSGTWHDVTDHWPQKRDITSPVFTGRAILVSPGQGWCGVACSPKFAILHAYFADPATLRRTLIPAGPLAESVPAYVWTGRAIIAMNTAASIPGPHPLPLDATALFNPLTSAWTQLPAPPGHPPLAAPPLWTGSELLTLTSFGQLLAFTR